jgi:acetyl esterase/lipase
MTHVAHVMSRVVRYCARRFSNARLRKAIALKMQLAAHLNNSGKFSFPMDVLPGTPGHLYASRRHAPGRRDRWGPGDLVVVYIHGGGFHLLGPQYCDDANLDVLRTLERDERVTSASLVCVEYPLAPRDCWFSGERGGSSQAIDAAADTIKWLHREWGVPVANLVISGDSAGGNLTLTASAQLVRENFFTPTQAPKCLVV